MKNGSGGLRPGFKRLRRTKSTQTNGPTILDKNSFCRLSFVICHLSSVFCLLSSVFCPIYVQLVKESVPWREQFFIRGLAYELLSLSMIQPGCLIHRDMAAAESLNL